jgi:predicted flavoprotein YhiN
MFFDNWLNITLVARKNVDLSINFSSGDTIEWFEKYGVELKTEDDGRMFPVSNSSQTIIDCFLEHIN